MRSGVVIPAYNEEALIAGVVHGVRRVAGLDPIIVVDDGSSDRTARVARGAGALVIRHPRNRGVGAALRTGFRRAVRMGCGRIVVMGGDAQDVPGEIPRLLRALERGNDFVQGSRWLKGGRRIHMPLFRVLTTALYSAMFTRVAGRTITDGTNGFRAFRAAILRRINLNPAWLDRYELEPYFYYSAIKRGFRVTEVPVTKIYPPKGGSYTKMLPVVDWWRILKPLVYIRTGIKR